MSCAFIKCSIAGNHATGYRWTVDDLGDVVARGRKSTQIEARRAAGSARDRYKVELRAAGLHTGCLTGRVGKRTSTGDLCAR